jgi:RNA polymerase sigma factor (sigma-70 family)
MTIPPALAAAPGSRASDEAIAARALTIALRTARGVLGDPEAAADVAQEVAIIALRRRSTIRDPAKLDAWLHRVATRAALRHARRESRRRTAERHDTPEAVSEAGFAVTEAKALFSRLPARQRAALTLRYVHDLGDADIGSALRCSESTVRTLLARGRDRLRAELDHTEARDA